MARLLRVEYDGAIHPVTVRSNSGSALYRDDRDREYCLYRFWESAQQYKVRVYLYCLMSNPFHLVVETPRGNLGRFMHSLLTVQAPRSVMNSVACNAGFVRTNR